MAQDQPPSTSTALVYIGIAWGVLGVMVACFFGFFFMLSHVSLADRSRSVSYDSPRSTYTPPTYTPPTYTPPTYTPPVYTPPPQPPTYVPPTPPPPPEPLHLTFSDLDEALKYTQSSKQAERLAAAKYLEDAKPTAAGHDKVFAAARAMVMEDAYRPAGVAILKAWSTAADLPVLREVLAGMLQSGVASNGMTGPGQVQGVIGLLAKFKDKESAAALAQCLKTASVRESASAALLALGADAEVAVAPLTLEDDAATAKEALQILAQVGTEKSTIVFHRAGYLKGQETSTAAEAALKEFATRLKLKPEQYLYVVYDHYAFTAPASFTADTTYSKPNSKQWTRTAPNRSVKSIFTVTVKLVAAGYQINAVQGTVTEVGTLKFVPVEASQSDNLRQVVHYAALDGEYLIDLVMTLDRSDTSAANSMTTAVRAIRAK